MTSVYWEVKRDGVVIGHGSKLTMPSKELRKELRSAGYKIYVCGKIFRDEKECKKC